MTETKKRKIAGIDLGTTYSAIAHFDEYGKAVVVPNGDNDRITPSVILFEENEVIVGKVAKNQAVANPENVVQFIKRHMGEPDYVRVISGREYTPEILSAIILKRLVSDAEAQTSEPITDVVITCPAYFNDSERKATQDAGKIAGLNVLGIINEPTAAALAFGMNNLDKKAKALVYDLGGGTFDVTVLEIEGNSIRVLATAGERRLGGKDWDDAILNLVAEKFIEAHGTDPREDLEANQDLVNKCEDAKIILSKKPHTKIFAQCGGKSLKVDLSREQFEELTRPLVESTETYLDVVLKKAELTWNDIDCVLHVGGMSRMPAIQEMLRRVTGKEPEKGVNPDESVAVGAVYWGAILLMREAEEAKKAAEAQPQAAAVVEEAKQAQAELAAAVPEQILLTLPGVVVQNVNSHSLGIVTVLADGKLRNTIMIPEQTALPFEKRMDFAIRPNQVSAEIKVLEGESEDPEDCTEIGTCVIADLPKRAKEAKIQVTYSYREDGRIEVHAKDVETGKDARTEIQRESALSPEEIEKKAEEISTLIEEGPQALAPADAPAEAPAAAAEADAAPVTTADAPAGGAEPTAAAEPGA